MINNFTGWEYDSSVVFIWVFLFLFILPITKLAIRRLLLRGRYIPCKNSDVSDITDCGDRVGIPLLFEFGKTDESFIGKFIITKKRSLRNN